MSSTNIYEVKGMTCEHCVASVTEEVAEIPGVENVQVELESGILTVISTEPIDDTIVHDAVEEAGYQVA